MKTQKRTEGPDISAIIDDLSGNQSTSQLPPEPSAEEVSIPEPLPQTCNDTKGRLWEEFVECLNDTDEDPPERTKLYAIDDDIVETLHQCSFGRPNVSVINSILRTFLVDNIERLRELHRPRSVSLLDKY